MDLDEVLEEIRMGRPILIYDSDNRERETDITISSKFVTKDIIKMMRKDGGGLICTTLPYSYGKKIGIDYLVDIFKKSGYEIFQYLYPNDIPYDEKSAFSITINHRRTFTGITDNDRALTIYEFYNLLEKIENMDRENAMKEFGRYFRSPGHVHLLLASDELLKVRRGHTELSTALMKMAGLIPSATIVEMMGDDGNALPKDLAKKYAEKNGMFFIEGSKIIEWWNEWSE
ncbi:MAG: 3,4-dihydroxy-2-butanone-4-phosphate synthase [Thermoplasmata archaeon]|jgi:3,4-dihydroxy 2-butanone 4-phosphate synthase